MKGILKFDLPDEHMEHLAACKATQLSGCIWDLDQTLRGWLKYGHEFKSADEVLEKIREELWEEIRERGLEEIINS